MAKNAAFRSKRRTTPWSPTGNKDTEGPTPPRGAATGSATVVTQSPGPEAKRLLTGQDTSRSPFSVTLGQLYDGPLDLLLDLIRKQSIDIYDIPIARITAEFMDYTHQLKQTDMDAAGEFLYMASLVIHIKSRTLLPRDLSGAGTGTKPEDPRQELVDRLLEHERFKSAAQMLSQKHQVEEATWTRSGVKDLDEYEAAPANIVADLDEGITDNVDLVRVFQDILTRLRELPILHVDEETVTVSQMLAYVKRRLMMEDEPMPLSRLLPAHPAESTLICIFLATLELVRLHAVLVYQPVPHGDILLKRAEAFDEVFNEQNPKDDWQ